MRRRGLLRRVVVGVVLGLLMTTGFGHAGADHAYRADGTGIPLHWPKTGAEAQVVVVESVASTSSYDLDLPLRRANARWKNQSDVIFSSVEVGSVAGRQACEFLPGKIRVCNFEHGTGGSWRNVVGLTSFFYNPENGHISKAKVRLNDSYLEGTEQGFQYLDDPLARQEVLCHELGHALGLNHQANSCLRSRIEPALRWYPNPHDYGQLETSYHAGSGEGAARSAVDHKRHDEPHVDQTHQDNHVLSVRDAPNGEKEITFVRRVYQRPHQGWTGAGREADALAFSAPGLKAQDTAVVIPPATSAFGAASLALDEAHPHDAHVHGRDSHAPVLAVKMKPITTASSVRVILRPHPLP